MNTATPDKLPATIARLFRAADQLDEAARRAERSAAWYRAKDALLAPIRPH